MAVLVLAVTVAVVNHHLLALCHEALSSPSGWAASCGCVRYLIVKGGSYKTVSRKWCVIPAYLPPAVTHALCCTGICLVTPLATATRRA